MYLAGAAVALGLILVGTDASFSAALILICTVALATGIHPAIGTVVEQRARGAFVRDESAGDAGRLLSCKSDR